MKLKATIISLVSVFVVGLTAILLYCYWPAIKGTVDDSKYYTSEELQESYDKGFDDGCKSETELTGQVKHYKDLVDEYYIQVNTLNEEITMLTNSNKDYKNQVTNLESQKSNLQLQVNNLTTIKSNNEETISDLNNKISNLEKDVASLENTVSNNETIITNNRNRIEELEAEVSRLEGLISSKDNDISSLKNQISTLKNEISMLETENANKDSQIVSMTSQISNLQSLNSQLQTTNELNLQTINNLNSQITSLNTQITDMTLQLQNNSSNVTALNNKIAELEKSISYYEQYIANLENDEKVAVTFEFNNSVYNIQIINKNGTCSVVDPTSTDYVIFNYWTIDGDRIDLTTKTFSSNTKVVANVTYKYDVKFMVEGTEYNSQIITKNSYSTLPADPTKDGYEFDGWTKNSVDIVDPATDHITQNTTYIAKFTKLHTVTFMYDGSVKETQKVRNGNYPSNVAVNSTTYKLFNGWKLNDTIVDITTKKNVADTVFVADITYKYDVKFMVDETVYNSQIVTENSYPILPNNPTKTGYEFVGWTLNGIDLVSNIKITAVKQNVTYIAKFSLICGLYETMTNRLIKSWDKLVADGDIVIDNGSIKCANTGLAGDLIVPNVNGITNMSHMFNQCISLTSIDLSNFDTSNVTDMSYMFAEIDFLTSLDLSNFNTSNVTNMSAMFLSCQSLTSLNLSNFNTSNVIDMSHMFAKCVSLISLDISNFDTSNVTNMTYMFRGCEDLSEIIVGENYTLNNLPV